MGSLLQGKSLLVASFGAVIFTYLCWKHKARSLSISKKRQKKVLTMDDLWNTAMFFPDFFPEKEDSTTRQLIWYLEQATETIDVCVFCINFKMLEEALIRIASKGVRVRILTNHYSGRSRQMRRVGIKTRTKIHTWFSPITTTMAIDLLHHKFVIIDDKAILNGSLNWTWSSITENFENVAVTTSPLIRKKLKKEFERLWEESAYRPGPTTRVLVNPGYHYNFCV